MWAHLQRRDSDNPLPDRAPLAATHEPPDVRPVDARRIALGEQQQAMLGMRQSEEVRGHPRRLRRTAPALPPSSTGLCDSGLVGRVTDRRRVVRVDDTRIVERPDTLAVEEPLEIRADGRPLAVTMRTPGYDVDLALGFLFTEGLVAPDGVLGAVNCADNVVDVTLAEPLRSEVSARGFYVSSSCGVCGKASIDAVRTVQRWSVAEDVFAIAPGVLITLPE